MKSLILILMLSPSTVFAHGDAAPAGVGPGKGVEYYDEHEGFILSKEAKKNFDLKTRAMTGGKACDLKALEVVQALNDKKVYRIRDSKIQSTSPHCENFKAGDEGVIHGASFLRVVEMDLQESGSDEAEEAGDHHD